MQRVTRGTPPTPAIMALSMTVIGLEEEAAHQLWQVAWQSTDPTLRAWRFAVDHIMRALMNGAGSQTVLDSYLSGPFSARAIVNISERLWHENRLSRKQANIYQDAMLRHAGSHGEWLLGRYIPPIGQKPAGITFKTNDFDKEQTHE